MLLLRPDTSAIHRGIATGIEFRVGFERIPNDIEATDQSQATFINPAVTHPSAGVGHCFVAPPGNYTFDLTDHTWVEVSSVLSNWCPIPLKGRW